MSGKFWQKRIRLDISISINGVCSRKWMIRFYASREYSHKYLMLGVGVWRRYFGIAFYI